jgi:hypothetical protein
VRARYRSWIMRIWASLVVAGIVLATVIGVSGSPAASGRNARIAGRVLVCNTPTNCMTRTFKVSAENAAGQTLARTRTTGARNKYRLRVPPGSYDLVAVSSGLLCHALAAAAAHHTTHQNITCLVP